MKTQEKPCSYDASAHLQGVKMEMTDPVNWITDLTNELDISDEPTLGTDEPDQDIPLCACCDRQLRRTFIKRNYRNNSRLSQYISIHKRSTRDIQNSDFVCDKCYIEYLHSSRSKAESDTIDLSLSRGISSHHLCTFGCKTVRELIQIPSDIRNSLIVLFDFYTTDTTQMCQIHSINKN